MRSLNFCVVAVEAALSVDCAFEAIVKPASASVRSISFFIFILVLVEAKLNGQFRIYCRRWMIFPVDLRRLAVDFNGTSRKGKQCINACYIKSGRRALFGERSLRMIFILQTLILPAIFFHC